MRGSGSRFDPPSDRLSARQRPESDTLRNLLSGSNLSRSSLARSRQEAFTAQEALSNRVRDAPSLPDWPDRSGLIENTVTAASFVSDLIENSGAVLQPLDNYPERVQKQAREGDLEKQLREAQSDAEELRRELRAKQDGDAAEGLSSQLWSVQRENSQQADQLTLLRDELSAAKSIMRKLEVGTPERAVKLLSGGLDTSRNRSEIALEGMLQAGQQATGQI